MTLKEIQNEIDDTNDRIKTLHHYLEQEELRLVKLHIDYDIADTEDALDEF